MSADRLTYVDGTRRIDMHGGAQVEAKGWRHDIRFERVVFVLTKDGVDLKRASQVEVRNAKR